MAGWSLSRGDPEPGGIALVPPTLTMRMTWDAMCDVFVAAEQEVEVTDPVMAVGVASVLALSEQEARARITAFMDWVELQSELAEAG